MGQAAIPAPIGRVRAPKSVFTCAVPEYLGVYRWLQWIPTRRRSNSVAKADSEGRYKGCKPIPEDLRHDALKLAAEGATRKALASQLGIG
jgi:hypothetical protein